MARWNWSLTTLLLCLYAALINCDKQEKEQVEGFFSQSGHTNNWAVLVRSLLSLSPKHSFFSHHSHHLTLFCHTRSVHHDFGLIIVM